MNARLAPNEAAGTRQSPPPAVLSGRWLFAARIAWIVLAALCAVVFVASVTVAYTQLRTQCEGVECNFQKAGLAGWLPPRAVTELEQLGLSLDFYAAYKLVAGIAWTLGYWAIGAILFWKRSNDRLALFASIACVTLGAANIDFYAFLWVVHPGWHLAIGLVAFIGSVSSFVLSCLFPDGRFVPRWMRWAAAAYVPISLYHSFFYWSLPYSADFVSSPYSPKYWLPFTIVLLRLILLGSLVPAQIYRYWRVSGPVARQQTKWVVFSLAVFFVTNVGVIVISVVNANVNFLSSPRLLQELTFPLLYTVGLLIPLSFAVAILRYRLWDIDVIINRTLVYGTLSAVLAAVFAIADALVLPFLVKLVVGEENDSLNVGISAVIIAVLFEPLRRRIRKGVDKLSDRLAGGDVTSETSR